ncbi:MAG: class I SAM-dependent methyltransferase [Myxococcota bacterium]|nr:class I SAM-dependent methyltransferase [Myxococcota bacterium]
MAFYKVRYNDGSYSPEGHADPEKQWESFGLPARVDGLKLYDFGTWDGGLAIEAARRGAGEVWGLDSFVWEMWPPTRADFERNVAATEPKVRSAYVETEPVPTRRLTPGSVIHPEKVTIPQFGESHGPADVIVAAGVFYHLQNPLKFLEDLKALMHEQSRLYVTTWCVEPTQDEGPVMRFAYGWREDDTNYWVATASCVISMAQSVGLRVMDAHIALRGRHDSPEPLVMFILERADSAPTARVPSTQTLLDGLRAAHAPHATRAPAPAVPQPVVGTGLGQLLRPLLGQIGELETQTDPLPRAPFATHRQAGASTVRTAKTATAAVLRPLNKFIFQRQAELNGNLVATLSSLVQKLGVFGQAMDSCTEAVDALQGGQKSTAEQLAQLEGRLSKLEQPTPKHRTS